MKKTGLLLVTTIFLYSFLNAQKIEKDSSGCKCVYNIPVKYPDLDEKDQLHGTVIAEYEVDSLCVASNPKIVQSLGPDYDKEVLRVTTLLISTLNKCNLNCKYHYCVKRKVKLPINFASPGD